MLVALLVLRATASSTEPGPTVVRADDRQLAEVARSLEPGERLRVEELALEVGQRPIALDLERFEVFAPRSVVVLHGERDRRLLEPPANAYLRGRIADAAGSLALLTVREPGDVRGLIVRRGRIWIVGGGAAVDAPNGGLTVREIDLERELGGLIESWRCAADELWGSRDARIGADPRAQRPPTVEGQSVAHTARIAIETDREFFDLFGNSSDAVDYVGDLIAYGSTIYSAEVETSWRIESIHLYSAGSDPWQEVGSTCALLEFGRYWNDNHSDPLSSGYIDRTIAHFLSGKRSGGGVAWIGVLCSQAFDHDHAGICPDLAPRSDNYGGGYGFSGNLSGGFDLANPSAVWDMVVVAHEIGHNFDSRHTHCYGGVGGNPEPVDGCYAGECASGCYCGPQSLPQPRIGSCGPAEGCGTIMSYCHLLSGGLGNISLTLGLGHPFGIEPGRVPDRMRQHVVSTAAFDPACLAPALPRLIFEDDFESGNLSRWDN